MKHEARCAPWRRAVLYFAIVSAVGLVDGPIRVFWLEPVVKTFIAANFGLLPPIIFWE